MDLERVDIMLFTYLDKKHLFYFSLIILMILRHGNINYWLQNISI